MIWTYCSNCGLSTEWAASCSECGSANPLYRPPSPLVGGGETEQAQVPAKAGKSASAWRLWAYIAVYLMVCCAWLAVLLVLPPIFW